VLPPENRDEAELNRLKASTLLKRLGKRADVATAVRFFLETDYITGQILAVDGGQMINRDR